jgi:ribosome-binding factor A
MEIGPRNVRRAKKASLYLREISALFFQAAQDNPELRELYPNRVAFSPDLGSCTVFFYSPNGRSFFEEKLSALKLFKPSLRAAMASRIDARRVPDFVFRYDEEFEKQKKVDDLIEKLKAEGKF